MSKQYGLLSLFLISYLKIVNAAIVPLRPLILSTSTYKPSTLLLPPGFDSQKAPRQPMLYPYAVSPSGTSTRPKVKNVLNTTSGWIPVALNGKSDLPLLPTSYSTTPAHPYPAPVLKDRISNDQPKYSSPSYKEGPVFESIVYGTWKPDPPLQPVKVANSAKHQQHGNSSNMIGNSISGVLDIGAERAQNKIINRQHGGFMGNIQQKFSKADRKIFLSSTPTSVEHKSKEFAERHLELKLQRRLRKQGRRKIRPNTISTTITTTPKISIEKSSNRAETTSTTTTKENRQHQKNIIKVNATDPKLTEVAKQINESIEVKYNHKQTSTHSIDVMATATANANNDDDEYVDSDDASNTVWSTKSKEFFSTVTQADYDDDTGDIFPNISATRRSWPTDFIEESLTTTYANYNTMNNSDKFNDSLETDPSETPLALSALNIPPSLWPKLPGNITKLGKPYEAESSAEEPALCVPITVREHNMKNSRQLVYIERVFCFPMPLSTTISEINENNLESTFTSSTTTSKTFTIAKVHNFDDFVDSRVSNASSIFKSPFYLSASIIIVIYFKVFV